MSVDPRLLDLFLETLSRDRKVFVSYHHELDHQVYSLFASIVAGVYDCVVDRSVDRAVDSDDAEYVMRRIRENHITGTSCSIVLCGNETPWRKYVDWEIKASLDKNHGLIGVRLPTARVDVTGRVIVPDRLHDNMVTGYAEWVDWSTVVSGAAAFKLVVERARLKSATLINNSRPARVRNG
jgi:hypothetical protein